MGLPHSSAPQQYERVWAKGSKARSVLALTHPTAVLVFSSLTTVLAFLAQREVSNLGTVLLLGGAMALGQATIGLTNEVADAEIDAVTKPWRALPAGLVTKRAVVIMAAVCCLVALLLAGLVTKCSMLGLAFGILLGVSYNVRLKRTPFSWLPYALAYPSLPVWVWLSLGRPVDEVLAVNLIASPLAVSVHMINQLRDYAEDLEAGIRGFVQYLGRPRAVQVCFALLVAAPIPAVILQLLAHPARSGPLLVGAGLHWLLITPLLKRYHGSPDPDLFRSIFRRLQISAPVMLVIWLVTSR